jgi:membrane protease YdiL (CAAX protease family)
VSPPAPVFPNFRQSLLLLGGLVIVLGGVVGGLSLGADLPAPWLLGAMLGAEAAVVVVALRLARWPLRRILAGAGFSTRMLRRLLLLGAGNLLLIGSLLYLISVVIGPVKLPVLEDLLVAGTAAEFAVVALGVAAGAPILEELLVRGVVLRGLVASRGRTGGVLLSSLFFAVLHGPTLQAAPAFLNGVVWALVLLRTGSLGATVFLHALNNATVFMLVQASRHLVRPEDAAAPETGPRLLAIAFVTATGLLGASVVGGVLRTLARDPERLSRFWGLPVAEVPEGTATTADAPAAATPAADGAPRGG